MKEENIILYNDIKEDEFFYMPVNINQFRYILPVIKIIQNIKIIHFYAWYGIYRYFTNLLASKNSPVLKAIDSSYNRMFLFKKIKGPYILEPITNTIFTLSGNIINSENEGLDKIIMYDTAKEYIDFYENNPVAINTYSNQIFYTKDENNNLDIEDSEELEEAIEYIVEKAKDLSKREYEKLKKPSVKEYIKFIKDNN